ncbi:MAG: histidine phosphatase family protein [Oscillospiraceae bacterium]|nr:histidine phosphatase family protein [Oscillospiraceae bacterium]
MTTLYLIRHAESVSNRDGILCGVTECDLSDEGFEQTVKLAEYAPKFNIDVIYTSPLRRAVKTATALNWYINKQVIIEENLREINLGSWEWKLWEEHGVIPYEDGEDLPAVYDRIAAVINKIVEENDGKTVAVISHGCALCNFMLYVKGLPIERYTEISMLENTAVIKLLYSKSKQKYAVIYENETPHLIN